MRGSAASVVARSVGGDPAERRRRRLLAAAVAGCAGFALAAAAIATVRGAGLEPCAVYPDGDGCPPTAPTPYAPFLAQPGLRAGFGTGAALLLVPLGVLIAQAVRLDSAARERRSAALRLQGATVRDLRRIAAAEVWPAAAVGAALGFPVYLLLWLLLGVALPDGTRLVPGPGASAVVVAWPVVVAVLTAAAVVLAVRAARAGAADPLGRPRRRARPLGRGSLAFAALCVVVLVVSLQAYAELQFRAGVGDLVLIGAMPVLLVFSAVALGPWLVVLAGGLAVRSADPVRVLAGRRLLADPRTPGRPAGVLLAAGLTLGVVGDTVTEIARTAVETPRELLQFGVAGYLLAVAAAGFAVVVAAVSMVVGAGEQILETRRPTAALVALGVTPSQVGRMLRVQLRAAAVTPSVVGAVVGALLMSLLLDVGGYTAPETLPLLTRGVAAGTAMAAAASLLGAAVAARLLRGALAEASAVESLRTA